MWETQVRSLGREDPLEKEMVPHSSILAWRIPRTEKPGRLQSMASQRVRHDWATSLSLFTFMVHLDRVTWMLLSFHLLLRQWFGTIIVSYGCCNKSLKASWLKTIEIDFLAILEDRILKSSLLSQNQGVGRARLTPETLDENPFFASSSCWHCLVCDHITPIAAVTWPSPFLFASLIQGHLWLYLGLTQIIQDNVIISTFFN